MKEETQQSLKELQENTNNQVKELSKNIQDLKSEAETTKKSQRETILEIENLGKKSGAIDANINNRILRDRRKNLRCQRYHRNHEINSQRKCKMQKACNPKHPGNRGHIEKAKPKDYRHR